MNRLHVEELQAALAQSASLTLLDVRTADECAIARIDPSIHIPLHELPARLGELNPAQAYAILCHHGVRSAMAAGLLERNGFGSVFNVEGGIDAWSLRVDHRVPRY